MEYLIGLLSAVVIFIVFFIGIVVGMRFNNNNTKQKPPDIDKEEEEKEKRKIKSFNEDFKKLFNYDVAQATERKKV